MVTSAEVKAARQQNYNLSARTESIATIPNTLSVSPGNIFLSNDDAAFSAPLSLDHLLNVRELMSAPAGNGHKIMLLVQSISDVSMIRKKTGGEVLKRTVAALDDQMNVVEVVFWGSEYDPSIDDFLLNETVVLISVSLIFDALHFRSLILCIKFIQNPRVTLYQGKFQLTPSLSSYVEIDPVCPKTQWFRHLAQTNMGAAIAPPESTHDNHVPARGNSGSNSSLNASGCSKECQGTITDLLHLVKDFRGPTFAENRFVVFAILSDANLMNGRGVKASWYVLVFVSTVVLSFLTFS